jgi:hypothetical protein
VQIAEGVLQDYAGHGLAAVRAAVVPDVGDSAATAGLFPAENVLHGMINQGFDEDWYAVTLTAGYLYTIDLQGAASAAGTLADTFLELHDAFGHRLARNDDSNGLLDSQLYYAPKTSGLYYIMARGYGITTGSYTLQLAASQDVRPPQLVAADMVDEQTILLTFDEVVQAGSGELLLSDGLELRRIAITDDSQVVVAEKTVTLTLHSPLQADSTYGIHFASGVITDSAGNAQADNGQLRLDVGDSVASAAIVPEGGIINSELALPGDRDWFWLPVELGRVYHIALSGVSSGQGSLRDPFLTVHSPLWMPSLPICRLRMESSIWRWAGWAMIGAAIPCVSPPRWRVPRLSCSPGGRRRGRLF